MPIVNLTPHVLNIQAGDGAFLVLKPESTPPARVACNSVFAHRFLGIDMVKTTYGEIENLPDPKYGITYVVSGMVLAALKGTRPDVCSPGELIRDDAGKPIGCKGLRVS